MIKNKLTKFLGVILSAVMLFSFTACGDKTSGGGNGGGGGVIGGDTDEDPYVTELVITNSPTKIKYKPGEDFDSTGMTLTAIWSHLDDDGNHIEEELSPDECENSLTGPIDSSTTQITFTYEGKSAVLDLILDEAALVKVVFDDSMLSKALLPGTVNLYAGIKATAHYEDKTTLELSAFDIYEVTDTAETKIENPAAYNLTAGTHTFVAKYDKYKSDNIIVSVISGYTVESTNIVYSEHLDKHRDIYIGTNFLENPSPAVYEDADCTKQLISGNGVGGYLSDGTAVTFPNIKGGKYYRAGEENGVPCLQDVKKGHVMRFHIYSEADATVELILNAASAYMTDGSGWSPTVISDMQFNKVFDINIVKTNPETGEAIKGEGGTDIKEQLTIADEVILPGKTSSTPDMALWANFVDVSFGELKLQKGDNIIELIVTSDYKGTMGACAANIGSFKVLTLPETCEHNLQKVNGTPATCTEYGKADYWRCVNCSRTYSDKNGEVRIYNAPIKLPFGAHVPGAAATCKESQTCTECGFVIVDKATVAHTPGVDATCEREQKCTVCDKVLKDKAPHTFDGEIACGGSAECKVCHQTITKEHGDLKWQGNNAVCKECNQAAGKRYIIQAEDESNITLTATRKIESETVTSGWANEVCNSAEGGALSGLEKHATNGNNWDKGDTITVKVNVDKAGVYKIGMRSQANQASGNSDPQDLANMFKYKVNDGEYMSITGKAASSTQVGSWHRAYNWGIVYFGEAELTAGENTVVLEYQGGRGCNIDYFVVETAVECESPAAEIVYFNGQTNEFAKGAELKHDVLENVVIRFAVPEDKRAAAGMTYRDYTITKDMIGDNFDTSTAGEKEITLTVPEYAKAFTNLTTVTFKYTVTEN